MKLGILKMLGQGVPYHREEDHLSYESRHLRRIRFRQRTAQPVDGGKHRDPELGLELVHTAPKVHILLGLDAPGGEQVLLLGPEEPPDLGHEDVEHRQELLNVRAVAHREVLGDAGAQDLGMS